ncbi:MAG: hypothetical protein KAI24_17540 [Planctomycetes bacterium]|nr:hypothetical protein [Planctomycetota bacterium]
MTETMTERILTEHPEGKQGVNIERRKYDAMKRALLRVTPRRAPGVRFSELPRLVREHLPAAAFPPDASVSWYVTTVKLDLEARGLLERLPGSGPQRLMRVAKG